LIVTPLINSAATEVVAVRIIFFKFFNINVLPQPAEALIIIFFPSSIYFYTYSNDGFSTLAKN
jgi:hypothetical protein